MQPATDLEGLKAQIELRDTLKANIAQAQDRIKEAKTRLDGLNAVIIEGMTASGTTNFGTEKYRVSVAHKPDVKVIDPIAFMNWATKNKYSATDYMSLDTTRAKAIAKHVLEDNGEVVDGTEASVTEYLSVTAKKEKQS